MVHTANYDSPVGEILLAAKEDALIGLWIEGQKYFRASLKGAMEPQPDDPVLLCAKGGLTAILLENARPFRN